jgi:hypothetical protein
MEIEMADTPRSAREMANIFRNKPEMMARPRNIPDPVPVLEELATKSEQHTAPWTMDKLLYRIAVSVLSLLALISTIRSIVLVSLGKTTLEVLVSLRSAAVGTLVGLFAPAPGR